jgi:hypothetical protein
MAFQIRTPLRRRPPSSPSVLWQGICDVVELGDSIREGLLRNKAGPSTITDGLNL